MSIEIVSFYETPIDKDTSSSEVNQNLHKEGLGNINSLKNNKVERSSMDIKSIDSKVWRISFFLH